MASALLLALTLASSSVSAQITVKFDSASLSTSARPHFRLKSEVSAIAEHHVDVRVAAAELLVSSLRVETTLRSPEAAEAMLHVAARHDTGQLEWRLDRNASTVAKTICLESKSLWRDANETLFVRLVFSASPSETRKVPFNVTVSLANTLLVEGVVSSAEVAPQTPYVWVYRRSENPEISSVSLQVRSTTDECATLAVQSLHCPFHDSMIDVSFHSKRQTMRRLAVIDVLLNGEYEGGFAVVAITSKTDGACIGNDLAAAASSDLGPRVKSFEVVVVASRDDISVVWGCVIVLSAYVLIYAVACGLTLCFSVPLEGTLVRRIKAFSKRRFRKTSSRTVGVMLRTASAVAQCSDQATVTEEANRMLCASENNILSVEANGRKASVTFCIADPEDEEIGDQNEATSSQKPNDKAIDASMAIKALELQYGGYVNITPKQEVIHHCRSKSDLMLSDMTLKMDPNRVLAPQMSLTSPRPGESLRMKSDLYAWIIFLTGTFYAIPVFQLLKHNEAYSVATGDLDVCYYNFLCKTYVPYFEDFGHVFSNVAYIISGLYFMVMVRIRQRRYNQYVDLQIEQSKRSGDRRARGIPEQYGIFYAMGGALVMEGILSGCYHICPTQVNFQFDTTFMYVIAVLVFLKVYQFRHPDITSNAYNVFAFIGFAIFFEALGTYINHVIFWSVFVVLSIATVIYFVTHTYYNGLLDQLSKMVNTVVEKARSRSLRSADLRPTKATKFALSVTVVLINCAVAVFFSMRRLADGGSAAGLSRYLLLVLIINMGLYVLYYFCMKLFHRLMCGQKGENVNALSSAYFLLASAFTVLGCYFFVHFHKDSSRSPALSRELNADCVMLFFDNHDLWHFCSAAGLFFTFMMILTLEDNNLDMPRDEIPVF